VLLFLQRDAPRFWGAAAIARTLHLSESLIGKHLESLARGGLLDVRILSDVVYCFSPANASIA
jgi:hypothetical protein